MEIRKRVRYLVKDQVVVRGNGRVLGIGIIRNISLQGLYFEMENVLDVGAKVHLSFAHAVLADGGIKLEGRLLHNDGKGYGVIFIRGQGSAFGFSKRIRAFIFTHKRNVPQENLSGDEPPVFTWIGQFAKQPKPT